MDLQWTPIQTKMLQVLSDGKPHRKAELQACLNDELAPIATHIMHIRRKLRQVGHDIVCEVAYCKAYYRRVIIYTNDD